MNQGRHTQAIEPLTEEVAYGWTKRPDPEPPPRHRVFPRGWRDAREAAWTLAGFALTFLCATGGIVLLKLAVGK